MLHTASIYLYRYLYPQSHPTLAVSSDFSGCDVSCFAKQERSTRRHAHWETNDAWVDRRSIHRHGWSQSHSSSVTDTPEPMHTHNNLVTSKKCFAQATARSGSRYMCLCLLACVCVCMCVQQGGGQRTRRSSRHLAATEARHLVQVLRALIDRRTVSAGEDVDGAVAAHQARLFGHRVQLLVVLRTVPPTTSSIATSPIAFWLPFQHQKFGDEP